MRYAPIAAFAALFLAFFAAPAWAAHLPAPTDSYQADVSIEVGQRHLSGTVQHDHGRELRTIDSPIGRQTILVRPDLGKAWLLQKALGAAVEVDLKSPEIGLDLDALYRLEATPTGRETIAGLPTTRYRLAGEVVRNSYFEGSVWATDRGIIAKIDGTATDRGHPQPVKALLSNVRRVAQNPELFELPEGVQPLKLDGVMGKLLRGMGGGEK